MNETLRLAREAGMVSRFHTTTTLVPETVGQHSFNMVNMLLIMTKGTASRALLVAALTHDMGEPAVGDIPSPVKRALPPEVGDVIERLEEQAVRKIHPYLEPLSGNEYTLLSLADKLDGLCKCIEELQLGNRRAFRLIGTRYVGYIMRVFEQGKLPREAEDMAYQIINEFNREVLHGS